MVFQEGGEGDRLVEVWVSLPNLTSVKGRPTGRRAKEWNERGVRNRARGRIWGRAGIVVGSGARNGAGVRGRLSSGLRVRANMDQSGMRNGIRDAGKDCSSPPGLSGKLM